MLTAGVLMPVLGHGPPAVSPGRPVDLFHRYFNHGRPFHAKHPICTYELPCPSVMITIIADGRHEVNIPKVAGDEKELLAHYAKAGFDRAGVIRLGRAWTDYVKKTYGVDFTNLVDFQYLYSTTTIDGGIAFEPYFLDESTQLRVTTVTRDDKVQFLNRRLSIAGWAVFFPNGFISTGTSKETIPANFYHRFNTFAFQPCKGYKYGHCKNLLGLDTVFIRETTRFPIGRFQPGNFRAVNFNSYNDKFGKGTRTGVCYTEEERVTINYRTVLVFDGH